MKRALLVVLLLAGCRRPAAAPGATGPAAAADMALRAGWSRGFGAGAPAASATPGRGKKLVAPPADDDANGEDGPSAALPPELAQRASPPAGVALWIDGALARTRAPTDFAAPQRLDAVVGTRVRSLFVHGDGGDEWLRGNELSSYRLRLNHRGQIKLEPAGVGGGAAHGSRPGGRDRAPDHPGREREVRGVRWLEARTPKSPRLAGEPTP